MRRSPRFSRWSNARDGRADGIDLHFSAEDQVVNRVRHALKGFESLDDGVFL